MEICIQREKRIKDHIWGSRRLKKKMSAFSAFKWLSGRCTAHSINCTHNITHLEKYTSTLRPRETMVSVLTLSRLTRFLSNVNALHLFCFVFVLKVHSFHWDKNLIPLFYFRFILHSFKKKEEILQGPFNITLRYIFFNLLRFWFLNEIYII